MRLKNALFYSLKVWLTSVALGPLFIILLSKIFRPHGYAFDSFSNMFDFIGLLMYLSLLVSIPSAILLWLLTSLIIRFNYNETLSKAILTVIGFILTIGPFYLLFNGDDNPGEDGIFIWATSYASVIIAGIWFYKLKQVNIEPMSNTM